MDSPAKIADMYTKLGASRTYVYAVGRACDNGKISRRVRANLMAEIHNLTCSDRIAPVLFYTRRRKLLRLRWKACNAWGETDILMVRAFTLSPPCDPANERIRRVPDGPHFARLAIVHRWGGYSGDPAHAHRPRVQRGVESMKNTTMNVHRTCVHIHMTQ